MDNKNLENILEQLGFDNDRFDIKLVKYGAMVQKKSKH